MIVSGTFPYASAAPSDAISFGPKGSKIWWALPMVIPGTWADSRAVLAKREDWRVANQKLAAGSRIPASELCGDIPTIHRVVISPQSQVWGYLHSPGAKSAGWRDSAGHRHGTT